MCPVESERDLDTAGPEPYARFPQESRASRITPFDYECATLSSAVACGLWRNRTRNAPTVRKTEGSSAHSTGQPRGNGRAFAARRGARLE